MAIQASQPYYNFYDLMEEKHQSMLKDKNTVCLYSLGASQTHGGF